jgi:cyclopropane fatty-acyl-phospholipid synthase-like methyltransferase
MKPFSEACERNRDPILAILKRVFRDRKRVLEIGSGTGQHAAYFAPELPHLVWQASDVAENLPGIRQWVEEAGAPNLREPMILDVDQEFPSIQVDAVFSANTCHIMSWPQVERMFSGVGRLLPPRGVFALYGPFNYHGKHTSESNARFDAMLRRNDPASGLRDFDDVAALAKRAGLALAEDNAMPANNRLLIFQKQLNE